MAGSEPAVRVICGPTAGGKTAIAVDMARRTDLVVVSADSRQLYRDFDIGTAKPTAPERALAPHRGIDVLDASEPASAAWWADQADRWIRESMDLGRQPVVVGGSGLYLRALFGALFEEPPVDLERRDAIRAELEALDLNALRRWTATLDPARAHLGRTQLLRSIEVSLLTGRRLSDLHRDHARPARWRARYLVVDPGEALAARIEARVRAMLAAGWPEEVEALARRVPRDAPAWNATGYRAIRAMVEGHLTHQAAMETVIIETRQYAKRQRTWFRHQLAGDDVTRVAPGSDRFESDVARWWTGGSA